MGLIPFPPPKPDILSRRAEIIDALSALVPETSLITTANELKAFETDALTAYRCVPLAVVLPETTEQVAQGYTEEKMEVGAKSTSVLGISESQQGGVSLDTMVQRLVQKSVWEIDNKYK